MDVMKLWLDCGCVTNGQWIWWNYDWIVVMLLIMGPMQVSSDGYDEIMTGLWWCGGPCRFPIRRACPGNGYDEIMTGVWLFYRWWHQSVSELSRLGRVSLASPHLSKLKVSSVMIFLHAWVEHIKGDWWVSMAWQCSASGINFAKCQVLNFYLNCRFDELWRLQHWQGFCLFLFVLFFVFALMSNHYNR